MRLFKLVKTSVKILKESGFLAFLLILKSKYNLPVPLSSSMVRKAGLSLEISYWNQAIESRGGIYKGDVGIELFKKNLDHDLEIQAIIKNLLPSQSTIRILDVGSGPLTQIGKKYNNKNIVIYAIDPLADEYNAILKYHNITPIVKTRKCAAENISSIFHQNYFDFVYARNSIDHSENPYQAILEMIQVIKKNGYVLLQHRINEGLSRNYNGLHQWNFSLTANNEFVISSKTKKIEMTNKLKNICEVKNYILSKVK